MESTIKNIIREVPGEQADLSYYFDGDCFNENSGDYGYTLFIISRDRFRLIGLNIEEYERVKEQAENVQDGFTDVENGEKHWDGDRITFKEVMQDYAIPYTSHKCHLLREWAKEADANKPESIAAYLSITTGKTWETSSAYGYCQGDYVQIVYCKQYYPENVKKYGEIWLGDAKEFCVIDLDENGEETDSCYGYIVADCEARGDDDYKRLVCEWAGIKPDETRLEMIDGYHTYTKYEYRTA